jgi:predicted nucleic acid-binding protein
MTLADQGRYRAPSLPDLLIAAVLIAAVAECSGLTVLHLDKDFDLIADVTGQPVERLRFS